MKKNLQIKQKFKKGFITLLLLTALFGKVNAAYFWQVSSIIGFNGSATYLQNAAANPLVLSIQQCAGGISLPNNSTIYNQTLYMNTVNSTVGGTVISANPINTPFVFALNYSYTPSTATVGTLYYYYILTAPSLTTCGFTGTLTSSIATVVVNVPGPAGALNFDGIDDQVNTGTSITTTLNPLTNITVEAWVKPTSTVSPTGNGLIVGNYNSPLNAGQFLLRRDGLNYHFLINSGAGFQGYNALNTVTLNVWQHIAGVWNGTMVSVYVNGVLSGTAATAAGAFSAAACTNSVIMGWENAGGGEGFTGNMDEIRIWGIARTQCQINTYKDCEIPAVAPNLIANYHFNQGIDSSPNATVTSLNDASGNSFTGTLTTFALTGTTSNWVAPGGVVTGFTTTASPTLNITSSQTTTACPGTTANLTASGGTNYVWTAPLTSTVAVATITLQDNSPTYSVTGTATTGCAATGTFMQLVTANPVSVTTSNTLMCTGETVTLTATAGQVSYSWAPVTSTVNTAAISPTVSGNISYSVWATNSVTCPGYTWTTVFTQSVSACVGIQNAVSQTISFGVYPNPTSGILEVESAGANTVTEKIKVVNAIGQLVIEQSLIDNKATLNMTQLNSGIYFIKIGSATKKIVKE